MDENKYALLHAYNKIVRRGLVKPLACTHCGNQYTTENGDDEEPKLACYFCNSKVTLGLNDWQNVRAVVMEHNIDTKD